jgi:uncharacterized protein YegL
MFKRILFGMIYAKFSIVTIALLLHTPVLAVDAKRWYAPELVTTGEDKFEAKCKKLVQSIERLLQQKASQGVKQSHTTAVVSNLR